MATFHFVPLVRSAFPINPWLARFACVALRKVVPKLDPSRLGSSLGTTLRKVTQRNNARIIEHF